MEFLGFGKPSEVDGKYNEETENQYINREVKDLGSTVEDIGSKMLLFYAQLLKQGIEVNIIKTSEDLRKVAFFRKVSMSNKAIYQEAILNVTELDDYVITIEKEDEKDGKH